MNLRGEPADVGRFCGANEYTITHEGVRFYQDALDDRHPLHERFAPPLLHHSECYKHLGDWYLANLFGNLHAQQDWELFAPIPLGARVRTCSTIVDRTTRRGRDWVVNETDVRLASGGPDDGRVLVRGRTYQSFLPARREPGDAGFVVDVDSARSKPPRPPFPTATGPDLPGVTLTVDRRRCWMFSGPGRNYHTDAEEARKLGFPNIVVQGMLSTCLVSRVMQDRFGIGWLAGGRMSVKLTNVLWADETVTARARVKEEQSEGTRTRTLCEVWVEKADATPVVLGTASALSGGA